MTLSSTRLSARTTRRARGLAAGRLPFPIGAVEAVVALTALAALLRFSTLDTQSYWYDEAITVGLVERSFGAMLSAIPVSESTPPLYYVLAWGWSRVFGTGEAGLRSFSALLGTATIPAAYAAAREFVSQRSALVTAAFVAVSPFLVWFSQEARAYALLVFLATVSLAFFARALREGTRRSLVGWAVSASLALAAHYFAAFLVAAEGAWLLYRCVDRRATRAAVALVAVVAASLLPLAAYQARYAEHTAWISRSGSLGGRAAYLLHQLVIGAYPASYIRPIIVAVPVVVLIGLFVWTEGSQRAGALLALSLGVAAVAIPLVLALVGDALFGGRGDYFIYRNMITATVPFTIVAGAVFGAASTRTLGLVTVLVACVLLVAISVEIARRPDLQRANARGIASALRFTPTARVVLVDERMSLPVRLYLPRLVPMRERGSDVREIDVVAEAKHAYLPSADLTPPPGFRKAASEPVAQGFTIVRLLAPGRSHVTPASLARDFSIGPEVALLVDERSARG